MKLRKNTVSSNNYEIKISDEAIEDLDDILFWYKLHSDELSKEFYKDLKNGFNKILNNPDSYQKIYDNVRRCLMKKFPFSVIYRTNEINNEIVIITIFHNSRNPEIWKERIN